jgi:DNA-binding NarL/FixJ family response regulator
MKEKVIFLLLIIMILTSCAGNRKYDDLMQRADSIMNVNDDSAKVAIRMLDGIKPQLPEFSQSQKMRYELLRHKAMNKACITFTSDSVMKEVVDYYDNHGSANERMLANYVLGCVYRDMYEAPMALEYYNKATEQADTTAADCDYGTLYRVYSQMGFLFSKQYLPYQLLDAFGKAVKYAYLAKDTLNAIINYQNRENAYSYLGNKDSVIAINLHAATMFKQIGNNYAAAIAFGCNYNYYVEKEDTLNALKTFKAYFSTGYEGNSEYEDSKAYVLCQKGTYYMFTAQLDSAYNNLQQSLRLCKSYSIKAATTKALAQYYAKVNQPAMAMKYALQSSEYNDSDLIEARKTQLQQVQAMYDYSRNQEVAKRAEQKAKRSMQMNYMIVLACIMLFLLLSYIYRKQLALKKKKIAVSKLLYEDSLLKLKRLQDEKAKLVSENDNKLVQIITEKEKTINKLKAEINDIQEKYSLSSMSDVELALMDSSIYKKIKFIEVHPKKNMSEEDWKELADTVEKAIPNFIPRLKNKLSDKDYQICLLIRLGFSTSLIARLLDLSVAAISKSRKTMLKKICGKIGKPKDFDEYVLHIQ